MLRLRNGFFGRWRWRRERREDERRKREKSFLFLSNRPFAYRFLFFCLSVIAEHSFFFSFSREAAEEKDRQAERESGLEEKPDRKA